MPATHLHYDEADVVAVGQFQQNSGADLIRQDAGIFTARQLDYVRTRTYDRQLPPMKGLTLVPPSSDVPEWAETITYSVYDSVGIAKVIANYADDLPRADVSRIEKTIRVKTIGDSYGYNVNELIASNATGANLPTRKANAARLAIEIKLNLIGMVGDVDYGLFGLTNHPNIGTTTITGGWTMATDADVMLADLDLIYNAVRVQSKGVHTVNKIAMTTEPLSIISSKRLPDSNGLTVAEFFRRKHPGLVFDELAELTGAGPGGDDLIIAGEFAPDNITHDVPMQFNQLPAQPRNLELVVPCMARSAGVSVFYPLAFTKAVL